MTGAAEQAVADLAAEFGRWEALLMTLSEEETSSARLRNGWSVKDLMAHLKAWQQVTRARRLRGGHAASARGPGGGPPGRREASLACRPSPDRRAARHPPPSHRPPARPPDLDR